jgi:hypothetical protein
MTAETRAELLRMYREDFTVAHIAHDLGISISSVCNVANRNGLRRKKRRDIRASGLPRPKGKPRHVPPEHTMTRHRWIETTWVKEQRYIEGTLKAFNQDDPREREVSDRLIEDARKRIARAGAEFDKLQDELT